MLCTLSVKVGRIAPLGTANWDLGIEGKVVFCIRQCSRLRSKTALSPIVGGLDCPVATTVTILAHDQFHRRAL